MNTPWAKIVTSLPMWAIFIAHLSQNWGYWTLATQTPDYIDKVLGFHIHDVRILKKTYTQIKNNSSKTFTGKLQQRYSTSIIVYTVLLRVLAWR